MLPVFRCLEVSSIQYIPKYTKKKIKKLNNLIQLALKSNFRLRHYFRRPVECWLLRPQAGQPWMGWYTFCHHWSRCCGPIRFHIEQRSTWQLFEKQRNYGRSVDYHRADHHSRSNGLRGTFRCWNGYSGAARYCFVFFLFIYSKNSSRNSGPVPFLLGLETWILYTLVLWSSYSNPKHIFIYFCLNDESIAVILLPIEIMRENTFEQKFNPQTINVFFEPINTRDFVKVHHRFLNWKCFQET